MSALTHVLAVGLIVTQLSGCSLLDLLFGVGPDPSFDPDEPFPFPTAEVTFSTGTATIHLDDETVVLDELLEASSFGSYGFSVTWTNGEGWYLQLYGFPEEMPFAEGGDSLSIHRIEGNRHLTILDSFRCLTTTEQAGADGIVGSATCRGLQWMDYFSGYGAIGGFPEPIEGGESFDAEITFEAH